jgi:hypothetical protein
MQYPNNNNPIKSKAFSIHAVMNNPNMAKMIDEAINSPVGSVKRKKARSVLTSLNKSAINYSQSPDGQGGWFGDAVNAVKNVFTQPKTAVTTQQTTQPQMSVAPKTAAGTTQAAPMSVAPKSLVKTFTESYTAPGTSFPFTTQEVVAPKTTEPRLSSVAAPVKAPVKLITKSVDQLMTPKEEVIKGADKLFDDNYKAADHTGDILSKAKEYWSDSVKQMSDWYKKINSFINPQASGISVLTNAVSTQQNKAKENYNQLGVDSFANFLSMPTEKRANFMEMARKLYDHKVYSWSPDWIPVGQINEDGKLEGLPVFTLGSYNKNTVFIPKEAFLDTENIDSTDFFRRFDMFKKQNPGKTNAEYINMLLSSYKPKNEAEAVQKEAEKEAIVQEKIAAGDKNAENKVALESVLSDYIGNTNFQSYYSDLVEKTGVIPTKEGAAAEFERWSATGEEPIVSDNKTGVATDVNSLNVGDIINQINSGEMSEDDVASLFSEFDNSAKDYAGTALEKAKAYIDSGIGGDMFAQIIMGDKAMLGELLGLPEDVVKNLPESGLLADQLNDLYDTVKKNYDLDAQLDNITKMKNMGTTFDSDIKNYIRGKDEYLGRIDEMMDKTEDLILSMDTSNPTVAKKMSNYVNYLTVLQGRQNKRYTDFLNDSIDQYNAESERALNTYNTLAAKAKEDYDRMSAITTESYNAVKSSLVSLYDKLANADSNSIAAQKAYYDMLNAKYDATKSLYDAQKVQLEIENGGKGIEWDNPDTKKVLDYLGIKADEDTGALSFATYDPYEAVDWAADAEQKPAYAINKFSEYAVYDVKNALSTGKFSDSFTNHVVGLISGAIKSGAAGTGDDDDYNEQFLNLLSNSAFQTVKEYFLEHSSDLKKAVQELSGVDRKGFDKPQYSTGNEAKDRKNFLDDFEGSLGDYASMIFDKFYKETVEGVEGAKITPEQWAYDLSTNSKLTDMDASTLSSRFASDIVDSLGYQFNLIKNEAYSNAGI